jgi:hypothetical protein
MEAIETGFKDVQVADVVSPHPRQSQYRRHLARRHLEQILITKVKKLGACHRAEFFHYWSAYPGFDLVWPCRRTECSKHHGQAV